MDIQQITWFLNHGHFFGVAVTELHVSYYKRAVYQVMDLSAKAKDLLNLRKSYRGP